MVVPFYFFRSLLILPKPWGKFGLIILFLSQMCPVRYVQWLVWYGNAGALCWWKTGFIFEKESTLQVSLYRFQTHYSECWAKQPWPLNIKCHFGFKRGGSVLLLQSIHGVFDQMPSTPLSLPNPNDPEHENMYWATILTNDHRQLRGKWEHQGDLTQFWILARCPRRASCFQHRSHLLN